MNNIRLRVKDYSTYIFDLDGTLLDTLQDLAASVNYALINSRLPEHSLEEVRFMVGNGVGKLIRRAVPSALTEEETLAVLAKFREYYIDHSEDTTLPYPGIMDMLQRLRSQGKKIAVVSNKFDAATKKLCAKYFPGLVDLAIGEDEANGIRRKPAPDTVLSVIDALGCAKDDCVYIGDSDVDIDTAVNAGIDSISVLWGFRDKDFLMQHNAQQFISSPDELAALLDS